MTGEERYGSFARPMLPARTTHLLRYFGGLPGAVVRPASHLAGFAVQLSGCHLAAGLLRTSRFQSQGN